MSNFYIKHHGIKGQKWGVRRYQNKDGSLTPAGAKRHKDDEYDEERERYEQEVAARRGVKYVRKTKKEREAEDAENERQENERRSKEDAAFKRTEDRMAEVDKKLQAKYDFNSSDDVDKYYKEYDEEWFKILYEEREKEGLSHADLFTLDELYHHGIKGQKWGVRRYQNKDGSLTPAGAKRYKDEINAQSRTIKKGTEVQTISKTAINLNDTKSRRSKRLYVSYTDYDKDEYVNMMGNFMYGGDKAYKNTFVVKKDMKVASDKDVVDAFISLAKKDPAKTAKDIANAYNENSIFLRKSEKTLNKKISQLSSDPNDAKVIKMAEQYVKNAIVGTKSTTTDNFYAYLTKKGFDAISDTNDRKSGAQDPLIILNMNVIKQTGSVKLTSKDLEAYYNHTMTDEHMKKANDLSKVQHQEMLSDILQHHGIKGQKWGVRRYQNKDGSLTPKGKQRYGDEDNFKKQYPEDVKKSIKKAGSVIDKAKDVNDKMVKKANEQKIKDDISKMSDQELQKVVNRLNMEERYKQVMNSRAAENGKNTVGKILEYAGATLAVGASAITLYTQIRELKKN